MIEKEFPQDITARLNKTDAETINRVMQSTILSGKYRLEALKKCEGKELEDARGKLKKVIEDAYAEIEAEEKEVLEKQNKYFKDKETLSNNYKTMEDLQAKIEETNATIVTLTAAKDKAKKALDDLKSEADPVIEELKAKRDLVKENIDKLTASIEENKELLNEKNKEYSSILREVKQVEKSIQILIKTKEDLDLKLEELKKEEGKKI